MKIALLFFITIMFASINFMGCSTSCEDLQNEVRNQYGEPEEINTYNSGDYSSTDWWYWTKGIEFTFTKYGSEPCEKSTYTFSPIHKMALNDSIRNSIDCNKILIDKKIATDCPTCP